MSKNILPNINRPEYVFEYNMHQESLLRQVIDVLEEWKKAEIIQAEANIESEKRELAKIKARKCKVQLGSNARYAKFSNWFANAYILGKVFDCKVEENQIYILIQDGDEQVWTQWTPSVISQQEIKYLYRQRQSNLDSAKKVLKSKYDFLSKINQQLVNKPDTKSTLLQKCCPVLLRVSDDVYETAKVAAPIILSLTLSGTVTLPLQPIVIAGAALLIARMAIAGVCAEYNEDKK